MRLVLFVLLTGCQTVFPIATDEPRSCLPELAAELDEDRDGVANAEDACPRLANAPADDEDGDGIPDVCDLCPLAAEPDSDGDCDGVSDPCDPDDDTSHVLTFINFIDSTAVRLVGDATLLDGVARLQPRNAASSHFGAVYARDLVANERAIYETDFTIGPWATGNLLDAGIRVNTEGATALYGVLVRSDLTGNSFQIRDQTAGGQGVIATQDLPLLDGDLSFHLKVTLDGTRLRGELSGAATATVEATIPELTPMIEYGVQAHDNDEIGLVIDARYIARISAR